MEIFFPNSFVVGLTKSWFPAAAHETFQHLLCTFPTWFVPVMFNISIVNQCSFQIMNTRSILFIDETDQAKFLIETQSQLDKDLGNIPVVTIKGAWIWFVCLANESSSIALIIFRRSFWSRISMSLILTMSLLDFIKCGVGGGNQKALPITKMVVTIKSNGNVVFILVLLSSMVRREMSMILYSWVTFVPRERWLLS